jgi:hypothetical protein
MEIPPDTKDWTWVLQAPCPDCGFDTSQVSRDELAPLAATVGTLWLGTLSAVDAPALRPSPIVWSPLEYACHVRDVFDIADYRVHLMLDEVNPLFANWDQDVTAVEEDYAAQDPRVVGPQVARPSSQQRWTQ